MVKKNVGKKIVVKMCEKTFLYSHEYCDKEWGGKNARNEFSRNTRIVRAKNVGKKSSQISAKNFFYIHMNIVTKNGREKTHETIFQKHE